MEKLTERVLIEVFRDKELDIFGIYKKREKELKARQNLKIIKIQEEKKKQRMIKSYGNICRVLIDTYGKEGAIPYLNKLFCVIRWVNIVINVKIVENLKKIENGI